MPPEAEVAETSAPEVAAPAADSPEGVAKHQAEVMAKHVALAQKANAAEAAGVEPEAEPEAEAEGEPKRGADGKFLPKEAKEKAAEAAPAKAETKKPEEKAAGGGLSHARRLFEEGRIPEAFKLAFGRDITDGLKGSQYEGAKKYYDRREREILTASDALEKDRGLIRQAADELRPLAEAKRALASGDMEKFIKVATGLEVTEFSRRLLHNFHGKNPAIDATNERIEKLERALAEKEQQLTSREQERSREQATATWKADLAKELADSGDERFESRASRKAFVERVFAIQAKHYDVRTDTTLPTLDAAEMAWDEIAEEYGIESARGVQSANTRDRSASSAASRPRGATSTATDRGGHLGRTAPKRLPTNLRQSEAAEAGERPSFKTPEEKLAYYVRIAQSEAGQQ